MHVQVIENSKVGMTFGQSFEVDGSPASMIATTFSPTLFTSNYGKRITQVEKLAAQINAEVYYPMTDDEISIRHGGNEYVCVSLRRAEKILRYLKRKDAQ